MSSILIKYPYSQVDTNSAKNFLNKSGHLKPYVATDKNFTNSAATQLARLAEAINDLTNYGGNSVREFFQSLINDGYQADQPLGDYLETELVEVLDPRNDVHVDLVDEQADEFADEGTAEFVIDQAVSVDEGTAEFEVDDGTNDFIERKDKKIVFREQAFEHSKALAMNYMRDFILQQRFIELAPDSQYCDADGQNWQTSGVSIAGSHTQRVNSDSFYQGDGSSSMKAIVVDGVSIVLDTKKLVKEHDRLLDRNGVLHKKLKDKTLTDNEQKEVVANHHRIEEIRNNSIYKQSSHYFAKILVDNLKTFNAKALNQTSAKQIDDTKFNAETAEKFKTQPFIFWHHLPIDLVIDGEGNFFDQVIDALERDSYKDIKDGYENTFPGFIEALKQDEVRDALTAVAPIFFNRFNIEKEFKSKFDAVDRDVGASATLSYAMDLGNNKIALVSLGDSPNRVIKKDGQVVDLGTDPQFTGKSDKPKQIGVDFYNSDNSTKLHSFAMTFADIKVYDKDEIETIFLSSDGISNQIKPAYTEMTKFLDAHKDKGPKEIVKEALDFSVNSDDDRTVVVLKKSS